MKKQLGEAVLVLVLGVFMLGLFFGHTAYPDPDNGAPRIDWSKIKRADVWSNGSEK